jgi:hypothetical protein
MIYLTGDLHHMSLKTGNQEHCDITEIQVAQRYLKMLEEANVKVTFFVSGKSFAEEWDDLKPICENPLVEIGGHNFCCFKPELWHRVCNKLIGSYNGPAWYEHWEVRKTVDIIENRCGQKITCWRNHMYMHGPHTENALKASGVKLCSDGVKKDSNGPVLHPSGVLNFPLNVMPDHEHLYCAERTPEWVEKWASRHNWSDDYGSESYYVEEWTDRVLEELKQHEEAGIISNMLIHPITLYLCDKLKSFERILEYISSVDTGHLAQVTGGATDAPD